MYDLFHPILAIDINALMRLLLLLLLQFLLLFLLILLLMRSATRKLRL